MQRSETDLEFVWLACAYSEILPKRGLSAFDFGYEGEMMGVATKTPFNYLSKQKGWVWPGNAIWWTP